ncbi:MAG: hypothetical protein J3K34DRAFT_89209 [Monoraphidium minutum]|nr:MAG: hypothetical protein J3K34DRAFT_89209 [Monoraphidium minutum]
MATAPLSLELPWQSASHKGKRRRPSQRPGAHSRPQDEDDTKRRIYYGAGMLAGAMLLRYARRKLCRLPVVGIVAAPLLALVPCTLLGATAGAAVVYCVEERDAGAVGRKLLPSVRRHVTRAHGEVAAAAADLVGEAERLRREHARAVAALAREGERLAPALQEAAAEAERALMPAVERGQREVGRSLRALEDAAAGAGWDSSARHGAARRHRHHQPEAGAGILRRLARGGSDSDY